MQTTPTVLALSALLLSSCLFSGVDDTSSNNATTTAPNNATAAPNNATTGSNNATIGGPNNTSKVLNNVTVPPPPLCGNQKVDPGEICDPCPEACPLSTVCEPLVPTGDRSTCDFTCEAGVPPDECCGDAICEAGQICDVNVCVSEGDPRTCDDSATPNAYCVARFGAGSTCDQPNKVCLKGCNTDMDCVPWELCGPANLCEQPDNCNAAGMKSEPYCAWKNWGDSSEFVCMLEGNGSFTCLSTATSTPCIGDADPICKPWQACIQNMCTIPDSCRAARDGRMYCMFETGNFNTTCRLDGSCL